MMMMMTLALLLWVLIQVVLIVGPFWHNIFVTGMLSPREIEKQVPLSDVLWFLIVNYAVKDSLKNSSFLIFIGLVGDITTI